MGKSNDSKVLTSYDPNTRWVEHVVEVTVMVWDYSATFTYKSRGNIKGFDTLEHAAEDLMDEWYAKIQKGEEIEGVEVWDNKEGVTITLKNAKGEELHIDIELFGDLERMIVGVRIIEVRPYDRG